MSDEDCTCEADAGEIAPVSRLLRIHAARVVPAGFPPAGIELFAESADVRLLAGAGESRLKHTKRRCVFSRSFQTRALAPRNAKSKSVASFDDHTNTIFYNKIAYIRI